MITHVDRLTRLLAERLDLESVPDPDWTDRAAMDLSLEFERHRRYQSAKSRELLRTIEAYCKLRKASADGMANGECQMADGECQSAEGNARARRGLPSGRRKPTVLWQGLSTLPHSSTEGLHHALGDVRSADGGVWRPAEQRPAEGETGTEKVTNEAKLEMIQVQDINEFASENRGPARRERTQINGEQRDLDAMTNDRVETIVTAATGQGNSPASSLLSPCFRGSCMRDSAP